MPILVNCQACSKSFRAQDEFAGQTVPCPHCQQTLTITGPTVSPYDAFISYSSKDKTVADAAVATLENKGIRCWVAPRDIVPGQVWGEAIIDGINQSRMMVLIFSTHSNGSQQVLREVEHAVHQAIPIVPFRIENLPPSRAMGYFISTHHWLDAYHPPLEDHLEKLALTAESLLSGTLATRKEEPKDIKSLLRSAVRTLAARDNRSRVLAGSAVLLLLVGGLIAGLMYAMKDPKASPELIQAKADAEVLVDELRKLDPGQGFEKRLTTVDQELKAALSLFNDKQFGKALVAYQKVLGDVPNLKRIDEERKSAAVQRESAAQARTAAEKVHAAQFAKEEWSRAVELEQLAAQSFERGEFAAAAQQWRDSAAVLTAATELARKTGLPRIKALAFWAGFATENARLYRRMRPGPQFNEFTGKSEPPPADWPPYEKFVSNGIRILEAECKPNLGLEPELIDRFVAASELGTREAIVEKMLEQLRTRHADEVEKSFRLGVNLSALRVLCAFGEAAYRGLGIMNREFRPNRAEILQVTDKAIERAYQAGCSADTIEAIKKIRREHDEVFDGFLHGEAEPGFAFRRMRSEADKLFENFASVEKATEYFRTAQAAPRPPDVAPDPVVQEAVKALEKQRAIATFDIDRTDRPPIGLGLYDPEFDNKEYDVQAVFEHLPKLKTLQSLNLGHTKTGDAQLAQLAELKDLRTLQLVRTNVTDAGMLHLKALPNLTSLGLNSTSIGDAGAATLGELSKLEELVLYSTQITDASVVHLKKLTKLKELHVDKTRLTKAGFAELRKALPQAKITPEPDRAALPQGAAEATTEPQIVLKANEIPTGPRQNQRKLEIRVAAFSPDGRKLVSVDKEGVTLLWDLATQEPTSLIISLESYGRLALFSADGNTLFVGGSSETTVWDAATGAGRAVFGGKLRPRSFEILPVAANGETLVTRQALNRFAIWDVASKMEIMTFEHDKDDSYQIAVSPDGNLVASGAVKRKEIRLFDTAGKQERPGIKSIPENILALTFSPDGRLLLCREGEGSNTGRSFSLWDVSEPGAPPLLKHSEKDRATFYDMRFSSDSATLAFVGQESINESRVRVTKLFLLDVATWKVRGAIAGASYHPIACSSNGKSIATLGNQGVVVADATAGRVRTVVNGKEKEFSGALALSPDGNRIAIGCTDGTIKIWDVGDVSIQPAPPTKPPAPVAAITPKPQAFANLPPREYAAFPLEPPEDSNGPRFSRDGNTLVSGTGGSWVLSQSHVWDLTTRTYKIPSRVGIPVLSPDGRLLLIATNSNALSPTEWFAVDLVDGDPTPKRIEQDLAGKRVFSPDSKTMAFGRTTPRTAEGKILTLVDATTFDERAAITGFDARVENIAYTPDGTELLAIIVDREGARLVRMDPKTLEQRGVIAQVDDSNYNKLWISPDGKLAAAFVRDSRAQKGPLTFWEITSGKPRSEINTEYPRHFSFVADLPLVAVGYSSELFLGDINTGQLRKKIEISKAHEADGARSSSNFLAFSADRRMFASGGYNGNVFLWDLVQGQVVSKFKAHPGKVYGLAFSPDGRFLATVGEEKKLKVWTLDGSEAAPAVEQNSVPSGAAKPSESQLGTSSQSANSERQQKPTDPTPPAGKKPPEVPSVKPAPKGGGSRTILD